MNKKNSKTHQNKNLADILRQTEERLREAEEKYSILVENAIYGVLIIQDMIIKYANKRTAEVSGYTVRELIGMPIVNLVPPNQAPAAAERISQREKNQPLSEIFYTQMLCKDGTVRDIEMSGKACTYGGKPAVIAAAKDITEHKLAEKLIKQSEEKYRLLAEHTKDLVWLMDVDMNITYVSPSVERLTGYSADEIKKLPLEKLLTPASLKKASRFISLSMPKAIKASFKDLIFRTQELEFILKNGQTLWGECSFSFIRDDQGNVLSILGEARDITERKLAEEKLHQSEERYRTILEDIQEGYFEVDLKGNFTFFNDTVCRALGYSRDELMGMNNQQYIAPEELKKVFDAYHRIYTTGESNKELAWQITGKDGTKKYIEGFVSLLKDASGKPTGFRGITHEITERKLAEEKLQQTLESLRRAIGTTIQVLVSALESRDPYTAGHQVRVADIARAIATEIGLDKEMIEGIRMAGVIHDIGKLSIPTEILTKPTKLTDLEFSLIKQHAQIGYEMLKNIESPWPLANIVLQHHERINGSGYPGNLKEDEILLESRILAVADVVEAMASHRPYRPSLGIEFALEEIEKNSGILYDALVADACLRLFREKGYQLT
ncbi:MAG TPA: PAS domain S-box protein [Smithella sp.]|nr:PAS domain S-box protein [Smithella sp.]HOG91534.1 PAS domain S-box protein [Smithella sp.]HOU51866.1 PAS domain S-box protein [Smithella sp.]HQI74023.1 PAS domain S-box protein [Smithella sp.]